MPVIARAGQALGRDRPLLAPGSGLQGVKEGEADRLLQLRVALELDVGAGPEVVQILPLLPAAALPADVASAGAGGGDLVAERRGGALAPTIRRRAA